MPRPYGAKLVDHLHSSEPTLGVMLGRVCFLAKLPASYVAAALDTSRITVYGWFRGAQMRPANRKAVQAFIDLAQMDVRNGRLPAKNVADAKAYIEEMLGRKIG